MTDAPDNLGKTFNQMEKSISDGATAALHETVDFARKHEAALITAGIVVVGTVALVKSGAIDDLLSLVKPAGEAAGNAVRDAAAGALKGDSSGLAAKAAPEMASIARAGEADVLKGVKTYVFDLDRTLVPTGEAYTAHNNMLVDQLMQKTGLSHDFVSSAVADTTKQLHTPLIEEQLNMIKPIQDLYPGTNLNQKFPDIAPAVKEAYRAALKPKPEVFDMLDSLTAQGKDLHVFTASPPKTAAEKLEASGLSKYFGKVFTAAEEPLEGSRNVAINSSMKSKIVELMDSPKADESGYRQLLSHLHAEPHEVLMTGDTNAMDIAPAKQLGIRTAQANWFHRDPVQVALPDLTLETPGDLSTLVANHAH